jgi:WD40 repeat protein
VITWKAHGKPILSLAFSPDGRRLATAAADWSVSLWEPPSTQAIDHFPGSTDPSVQVVFSPDDRLMAWVGNCVLVWDLDKPYRPLFHADGQASQCCFSPDGTVFVAQGSERPLLRWDVATWKELPGGWGGTRGTTQPDRFPLGVLAYHPDGSVLATAFGVEADRGYDTVVADYCYLWDAVTGAERAALRRTFASAHPTAIAFSPGGRHLAAICGPHLVVWDVEARTEVVSRKTGTKHLKGLAFTPDGARLVTVSNDETVRLWDARSWDEVGGFEWQIGKLGCVAASPDGMRMAAGGHTGKVVVWDVD